VYGGKVDDQFDPRETVTPRESDPRNYRNMGPALRHGGVDNANELDGSLAGAGARDWPDEQT